MLKSKNIISAGVIFPRGAGNIQIFSTGSGLIEFDTKTGAYTTIFTSLQTDFFLTGLDSSREKMEFIYRGIACFRWMRVL